MVEALRQDGVSDDSIKERISKAYRDQYKEAYRNDDFVRMDEIEELLDSTGFSFNLSNWKKAVDNEEEYFPHTQAPGAIPGHFLVSSSGE